MVNNIKLFTNRLISRILVFAMLLGIFIPVTANTSLGAGNDKSNLINPAIVVKQEGATISGDGKINSEKDIRVEVSFDVPVAGDNLQPPNIIDKGDFAVLEISNEFSLLSGATIPLNFNGVRVATVNFTTNPGNKMVTAKVDFDGHDNVYDGTFNTVKCSFNAELRYNKEGALATPGDHKVTILKKKYTVNVDAPIVNTLKKTGTKNLKEKTIEWSNEVTGKQLGNNIDLENFKFSDDLTNVGEYVPNSFKVGGVSATPQINGNKIEYTFPDGSMSPKTITFKTKIPNNKYYNVGTQKVTNTAKLLNDKNVIVQESSANVTFSNLWISKTGAKSGDENVTNPTNREVTWFIEANDIGDTLNNVVITDKLPNEPPLNILTFKSARWEKWNGTNWVDSQNIVPVGDKYNIGNINTKIRLIITTQVPDGYYTTQDQQFKNTASIKWDGSPYIIISNEAKISVGHNAITKDVLGYDEKTSPVTNPKIKWNMTAKLKGQVFPDLKIYDLLVYSNEELNLDLVDGIPNVANKEQIVQSLGQRYVDGSFIGDHGLSLNRVIPILKDGKRVGDLLEIEGVDKDKDHTFSFETFAINPNVILSNTESEIQNSIMLFSGTERKSIGSKKVKYKPAMLSKQILKRESGNDPAGSVNTFIANNNNQGFNYKDKSVIFRLNVNAGGTDVTGVRNSEGNLSGKVTVRDTLPEGWEFIEITPGNKFLIFEGAGNNGNINAIDTTPDTVTGLTANFTDNKADFVFDTLNKPYVILVKAKPKDDKLDEYFNGNKEELIENKVEIETENWRLTTPLKESTQTSILSKVLKKRSAIQEAGVALWTIDYQPYEHLSIQEAELEDTLPSGIELRMDEDGQLIIDGNNFTVKELELKEDGTYIEVADVPLVLGDNISYDNETRVLKFKIPDSEKGYRFNYITDLTGEVGQVSNKVKLLGTAFTPVEYIGGHFITEQDGKSSFKRGGWIKISKSNSETEKLQDVEFTLYTKDGTKLIRRGVTDNNGVLIFKSIHPGEYTLKETRSLPGYVQYIKEHSVNIEAQGTTFTTSIDGKTGPKSNEIDIVNHKADTVGNLTISKTVVGNAADFNKKFEFTIEFTGVAGEFAYVGNGVPDGVIKSGDKIELGHGQSINILNLPKNTPYTVTEKSYTTEGYTTTHIGREGTIEADTTKIAAFTNIKNNYVPNGFFYNAGDLTISKTVGGNAGENDRKFEFTVTFNAQGSYNYTGNGVPNGVIKSGDKIELGHGESINILRLPKGTTYTVTEKSYSDEGYVTESINGTGTIKEGVVNAVSFTNVKNTEKTDKPLKPGKEKDKPSENKEKDRPSENQNKDKNNKNGKEDEKTRIRKTDKAGRTDRKGKKGNPKTGEYGMYFASALILLLATVSIAIVLKNEKDKNIN